MHKKGVISLAQIFILILGIIAISYTLGSGIGFVSSACVYGGKISTITLLEEGCGNIGGEWFDNNAKAQEYLKGVEESGKAVTERATDLPTATGTPTGYSSHGYAGEAGEALFGAESVAPKGYEWNAKTGEWVKTSGLKASSGLGYSITGIVQGALWGLTAYYMVQMILPMFGLEKGAVDAASTATAGGIFAGKGALSLLGKGGVGQDWIMKGGLTKGWATVTGIGVAVIIFYMTYKSESQDTITFTCSPWEAPVGGSHCEKCNQQGALPCSEYQCRSLGQACELLNPGTDEDCKMFEELSEELNNLGINVWFEELNIVDEEIVSFIYGFEAEGEKGYVECERGEEFDEMFENDLGEDVYGVFLIDKESEGFVGWVGETE
jgi:hypothetical protein